MSKVNIIQHLLVALKIGYIGKKEFISCKSSKFLLEILNLFVKENWIRHYLVNEKLQIVYIFLRYYKGNPLLTNFTLINKPSLPIYSTYKDLNYYNKKFDIFLLSTDKGLLVSKIVNNTFLKKNIRCGGQVLFGLKYNTFKLN